MDKLDIINTVASRIRMQPLPGDINDPDTGLLICGRCGTPKECIVKRPSGRQMIVGCMCACAQSSWDEEQKAAKAAEERKRIERLRADCIKDPAMRGKRFCDSEESETIKRAQAYVDAWEDVKTHNIGMLLWGPPGSGKTHIGACIANAIIDKGASTAMTSIPELLLLPYEERGDTIRRYTRLPLLVIDDLGAERDTSYGLEIIYGIVDGRLKSGKPMVITTNLSVGDLQNPQSMAHARIYQRVLEACQPVRVVGKCYRDGIRADKQRVLASIFGGER